ncbi:MAG: hypothetical protein QXG05_06995 [Nitrososphaerota archaeon]
MNEVRGLAPSQDWFMHSLKSRCIGAMHKLVDCDSSGVNLEPFLVRNRFRNTRVLIATAFLAKS